MIDSPKAQELKAWHLLLEDDAYRLDNPADFHFTLVARADELVLRGVIDLAEWQQLKDIADVAYDQTLHGLTAGRQDCIKTIRTV